jgi:hypothetical protein
MPKSKIVNKKLHELEHGDKIMQSSIRIGGRGNGIVTEFFGVFWRIDRINNTILMTNGRTMRANPNQTYEVEVVS